MCLEDRFLITLYNQKVAIPIKAMADAVSLTENALHSIIHRIQRGYPDYLVVHEEATDAIVLSPNSALEKDVRQFLSEGGFTAINEQEFRDYYAREMEEYTRLQKLKRMLQQYRWVKWTAGVLLFVGVGIGVAALVKAKRKNTFQPGTGSEVLSKWY